MNAHHWIRFGRMSIWQVYPSLLRSARNSWSSQIASTATAEQSDGSGLFALNQLFMHRRIGRGCKFHVRRAALATSVAHEINTNT
jgi:hypothetical protein